MFRMPEPLPDTEPTRAELTAIENEWPRIAADLADLDAEIRALTATDGLDQLAVRRARRERVRRLRGLAGDRDCGGLGGAA
jgi:hypothetical protein